MSHRYHLKCARCGSILTLEYDADAAIVAVHPCARCTPHPALMASAEDFAELRERVVGIERGQEGLRVVANAWVNDMQRVDRLAARVTALEAARVQTTPPMQGLYTPMPPAEGRPLAPCRESTTVAQPVTWSGLYGVRSTPKTGPEPEDVAEWYRRPGGTGEEGA